MRGVSRKAEEGARQMKLKLCIAIFILAVTGGMAFAFVGTMSSAQADDCGGYACDAGRQG